MMRNADNTVRRLRAAASLLLPVILFAAAQSAAGQTIAVIDPAENETSRRIAEALSDSASRRVKVLDRSLSGAAFRSFELADPFNMEVSAARDIGSAIGCSHFVLVRTALNSRSASGRPVYYEAHASYYLVSSRTGRLAHWEIATFEDDKAEDALRLLYSSVAATADTIAAKVMDAREDPFAIPADIEPAPELTEKTRPPMPYRRISPVYTRLADLHGITATVDIEAAIGADGTVIGTEIVRWAGYGLDESVESAVRTMQWRPGERNGGFLPMRVLLRYNFRDIDDVD